MSKSLDPILVPFFIRPDLGPNCLQTLSADDTRRQRVNCHSDLFDLDEKIDCVCQVSPDICALSVLKLRNLIKQRNFNIY